MGFIQTPTYKKTFSRLMIDDFEEMGQTIAASAYGKSEPDAGRVTRTWWAVHTKEGEEPWVSKTYWCQSDGSYTYRTEDMMSAAGRSPMPVSVFRKAKALGVDVEAFERHRKKKEQEHAQAVERYRREMFGR